MTDIIDLLESFGSDAPSHEAGSDELARRLAAAGVSPSVRAAIVSADRGELGRLLGAKGNVCCLINPAMDDEQDEDARRERECEEEEVEEAAPVREPARVASAD